MIIVITDIRIPKLDGINLIEKLRTSRLEVPIVIVTEWNRNLNLKIKEFSVESLLKSQ